MHTRRFRTTTLGQHLRVLAALLAVLMTSQLLPGYAYAAVAQTTYHAVRTQMARIAAARKHDAVLESLRAEIRANLIAGSRASAIRIYTPRTASLLDEVGLLARAVPQAQVSAWETQAAHLPNNLSPQLPDADATARALVSLGEYRLGREHQPRAAVLLFRNAERLTPRGNATHGLAAYDEALALFHEGAYAEAQHAFRAVLVAKPVFRGFDRRNGAMMLRHAMACAGYHEQHTRIGIPEPPRLDPACGAAAIAASLRAMHLPYDRATVLKSCRVTGEGSSLQDLVNAGKPLHVSIRMVGADQQGLMELPKPLIAFVEQDHFVSVVKTDGTGVSYLCSDCGAWPGGQVHLTWAQWRTMNPGIYAAVVKIGSPWDVRLAELTAPAHPDASQPIRVASAGNMAGLLGGKNNGGHGSGGHLTPLIEPVVGATCGNKPTSTQCPCVICCLMDGGGNGDGSGPSSGEPVNLATGEEEYTPGTDLTVYNPIGPSVHWGRIYNSLRSPDQAWYEFQDFGAGWSQTYNVGVYDPSPGQTGTKYVYQSNGGRIQFTVGSIPTASNPTSACAPMAGTPMLINFNYASGGNYFTIELPDRTILTTQAINASTSTYSLSKITDRNGNWISLAYTTTPMAENSSPGLAWPLLTAILDENNNPLLSINRATNGSGDITSVDDAYGRSVYYNCGYYLNGNVSSGNPQFYQQLDHVSQIVPTGTSIAPPDRYAYGYGQYANNDGSETVGFLTSISVPSPKNDGTLSTATISYLSKTCTVSSIVDANGNTHSYTTVTFNNNPNATQVTVTDTGGNVLATRMGSFDTNMSGTAQTDNNKVITSQSIYNDPNDPYKPSQTMDGNASALQAQDQAMQPAPPIFAAGQGGTIQTQSTTNTPSGNLTATYVVDSAGHILSASNGAATFTSIQGTGTLWTIEPPACLAAGIGLRVELVYTPSGGGPTSSVYSPIYTVLPGVTSYQYDQYGNVLSMTSPRGAVTTNTYVYSSFALGELRQSQERSPIYPARTPTTYTYYDSSSNDYTNSGLVQTVTSPLPGDVNGSPSTTVTTSYTYDNLGNVIEVVAPGPNSSAGSTSNYTQTIYNYRSGYQGAAGSDSIGEPLTTTTVGYDSAGNQTTSVSYAAYDARGNALSMIDALGNETDMQYNLADQQTYTYYPATGQSGSLRARTVNVYQYTGGPLAKTQDFDESGSNTPYREMDYAYGPEGETLTVNGATEPVGYLYDGLYRLASLSDGNVHTTQYFYNANGYLAGVTYPGYTGSQWPNLSGPDSVRFPNYDPDGNVLTRIDGNGTQTSYLYEDTENQLTYVHYVPGASVSALADTEISYDGYGRRAVVTDATGTKSYQYDDDDNLLTTTTNYLSITGGQPVPRWTTTSAYNADGSCKSTTYAPLSGSSLPFTSAYDGLGRMQSLTNPYGEVSSWTYAVNAANQSNNWLASQTLGSGVTTSYAYNPRGFLADLKTTAPQASGGGVISEFGGTVGSTSAMTYDAVGNRTQMSGVLNGVSGYQMLGNGASSAQYTYNSQNELTQEQTTEPGNGSYTNSYGYDGAQNRTTQNSTSIGHNQDNQLSASGAYAYDGNGNPTTYTSPGNSVNGTANVLTYDPENRMTRYGYNANQGTALLQATYDSDGLRVSTTNPLNTPASTYYLYDSQDHPVVELSYTGTQTSVAFVNTFGDNGLLSRRDVANAASTYYAFDPQGSAVDVMQGNNGLPAAYSAFGIAASGGASASPWGFGAQWGYYTDAETGLILCTHRYYDPYTGRFVNRDPISYDGGVNLYNYTANNAINEIDPEGTLLPNAKPPTVEIPRVPGVNPASVETVAGGTLRLFGMTCGFALYFFFASQGTAGGPGDELPNPPAKQPRFTCTELESQGYAFNSLEAALKHYAGPGGKIQKRKGPDPLNNGEPGFHSNYMINGRFMTFTCKPCKDNPNKMRCRAN